jgi:hypothetical protein
MILESHQPFASPEEALVHYGKKGMRWGIRNEEESTSSRKPRNAEKPSISSPRTDSEKKAARRAMAKKAAIGAGVLTAVAGAGFVAYKLNQSGKLPLSSIVNRNATNSRKAEVSKIIHDQKNVIMLTRGKYTGQTFLKKGDTPNFFTHWENAFINEVGNPNAGSAFQRLTNGSIAAAFKDPEDRFDFSGRPISHQVIIPRSMASDIESIDDVKTKIWPLLKDSYDEFYRESEKSPY